MPPAPQPTVASLFDLPETVVATDFVVELAKGVEEAASTVAQYVITDDLLRALGDALRLVGRAVESKTSAGTYLHGSFGSGKSHFLAILSLLMSGSEVAWQRAELHPLRAEHPWIGQKRLLQLRLHMLGKESLEGAIFGAYLAAVRAELPGAPIPPLFADAPLFENARALLDSVGDGAFFARMNGPSGALDGWVLTIAQIRRNSIVARRPRRLRVRPRRGRTFMFAYLTRGFFVVDALAAGRVGSGSLRCRQDSPSILKVWQCWVKRSTSAPTQAAPGKMVPHSL